jgi:hypothetical protein
MTRRPLRGAAIKPPSLSPWATGCTRKAGDARDGSSRREEGFGRSGQGNRGGRRHQRL